MMASAMRPPVQLSAVPSVCSLSQSSWLISLLIILLSNSMMCFCVCMSVVSLFVYWNVTFENAGASMLQCTPSRYL